MGRRSKIHGLQVKYGKPLPDILRDLAAKGLNFRETAAELGISLATVSNYFKQFGIEPESIAKSPEIALKPAITLRNCSPQYPLLDDDGIDTSSSSSGKGGDIGGV